MKIAIKNYHATYSRQTTSIEDRTRGNK